MKARRRRMWRKFLVCMRKTRRAFWRWFKRNSGKLTAILLIAWLCLIVIPPVTLAQGVLDLWCRAFGFECWCWCWGADCAANAETVRNLALVVVSVGLALAVREFLFRPEKTRQALGDWFKRNWQSLTAILSVVTVSLFWSYWGDIWFWLRSGDGPIPPNAETVRNLALVVGAFGAVFIGIPLALWRNILTHSQAKTAEHGLNNERYQKGAEMLGNETLAVRMGGISALERLAREHPEEYYVPTTELLCTFIRHPTEYDKPRPTDKEGEEKCPAAVEMAAHILGKRSKRMIRIARREKFRLALHRADLSGAVLIGGDLSDTVLSYADLSGAVLYYVDLSDAVLSHADLSGVDFRGAILKGADLSGAKLNKVKTLTQNELDKTYVWEGYKLPTLVGAVDPETGKPLVWQGEVRPRPDPESSET